MDVKGRMLLLAVTFALGAGGGLAPLKVSGETDAPAAVQGKRQQPSDEGDWSRDPFLRKKEKPVTTSTLRPAAPAPLKASPRGVRLKGIMKVDGRYFALVNERVVKAGDRFDGLTIEGISRYRVTIRDDSGRRKIDLYSGELPKGE